MSDDARIERIIVTRFAKRGDGLRLEPVRTITQFWSEDGDLLAEKDPLLSWTFARLVSGQLQDPPADKTDDWYAGWFAARDMAYETLTGEEYGS